MPTHIDEIVTLFTQSASGQLRAGLSKIDHCLDQLDQTQLWWRPSASMNSIANLMLHLSGNVRQWLIAGLSDVSDDRDRQQEFDDRTFSDLQQLRSLLHQTVDSACNTIEQQTAEDLRRVRRVQEFDLNGFQTIHDSMSHFQGHVQEIIHMTRCQLDEQYRFLFVPEDQR